MFYSQFENFLSNFSFLILFVTMIYYWINLSFNFKNKNVGTFGMGFANLSIFLFLGLRWKESGHFPLSNLYESFLFLSWNLTLIHLILEKMSPFPSLLSKGSEKFIGALTSPTALFTNAFATFSLPEDMKASAPLVPALQSNWLMMHVTVMILSYSTLICGSLLSIAFLILTYQKKENQTQKNAPVFSENILESKIIENQRFSKGQIIDSSQLENQRFSKTNTNEKSTNPSLSTDTELYALSFSNSLYNSSLEKNPSLENMDFGLTKKAKLADDLDNLSYRILGVGFPLLTIGILSGAVWANEAWGSYWSWDPKETWALLTWLVFAIYLHTRIIKGWQGKKPAIIASLGFFIVWICFLGVNLLGEGLHSYGFMIQK